ncbi:neuropilin-1a-like [Acanthaster planci]|uniref:Neuropilin-1a-like n=1 Tax=Acanthaster planci TaxID=133434 RepID=A0A8B7Z461_ACAPL|nr:neuropilin-1a-like [Acanthaster planci]
MGVWGFCTGLILLVSCAPRACIGGSGNLFVTHGADRALIGHTLLSRPAGSLVACAVQCHRHDRCLSFNFYHHHGTCQMNDARMEEFPASLQAAVGVLYFGGLETLESDAQQPGILDESSTARQNVVTNRPTGRGFPVPPPPIHIDTLAPKVICPDPVWSYTRSSQTPVQVVWAPPTAWDNADGQIPPTQITCTINGTSVVSGSSVFLYSGVTTPRCVASDMAGNEGSCNFSVTIKYCSGCRALGMESGEIPDNNITATSSLMSDVANYGPQLARLNGPKSWCANSPQSGESLPWIQVNLQQNVNIYGLIIQGRNANMFVSTFLVAYSDNSRQTPSPLRKESQSIRRFDSAESGQIAVHVPLQSASRDYITALTLRLQPANWKAKICMRFEVIGVPADQEP